VTRNRRVAEHLGHRVKERALGRKPLQEELACPECAALERAAPARNATVPAPPLSPWSRGRRTPGIGTRLEARERAPGQHAQGIRIGEVAVFDRDRTVRRARVMNVLDEQHLAERRSDGRGAIECRQTSRPVDRQAVGVDGS